VLAAGVDGCRGGWLCITRDGSGALASACFATAEALFAQQPRPDALAIDVPIGLLPRGARACDRAARALLAKRRSSVFPAPPRAVLGAATWAEACAIRERLERKRMSRQAWAIVAKIRDVDDALRREPARARWVREAHPEVCFARWSGAPMAHPKKKAAGRAERLALVTRRFGPEVFAAVRLRHPRGDVADDDLLDAFAALWTAERVLGGEAVALPPSPPLDATGLRMEIVA
jgi:predicted RNase H-like nuclease